MRSARIVPRMTPHAWAESLAEEVRAVMARKRRRGTELGSVLGLSQSAASRRMSGETPLSVDELLAIAEWLDVPFTDLIPAKAKQVNGSPWSLDLASVA